jgi:hypothetical protein
MEVSKFVLNNETINVKDTQARGNITTITGDITTIKSDITKIKSDISAINNFKISYNSSTETITILKQ